MTKSAPYTPEELPVAYDALLSDPQFTAVLAQLFPGVDLKLIAAKLRSCKTNQQVQEVMIYDLITKIEKECTDGVDMDSSCIEPDKRYTFVSNHRDIVLDSAFLSKETARKPFPMYRGDSHWRQPSCLSVDSQACQSQQIVHRAAFTANARVFWQVPHG